MYDVTTDARSRPQIDALPSEAVAGFAEARATLEVAPWNGDPVNDGYPDGPVRWLPFGSGRLGLVTYLIVEDLRRVDILKVLWLG